MRIIGYEFAKLFSHKVLWSIIGIFLLINLLLVYHNLTSVNEYDYSSANESAVYKALSFYPIEERSHILASELEIVTSKMMSGEVTEGTYCQTIWGDYFVLQHVLEQMTISQDYIEYLAGIFESAENMSNSIFWNGENSFLYRNAMLTVKTYQPLVGLYLEPAYADGVKQVLSNPMTDVFLILAMIAILLQLLVEERSEGMFSLLKSTANGRTPMLGAKIIVSFVVISVLTVFFYLCNLVLAQLLVSLGDIRRPIQTVEGFFSSPYQITVKQAIEYFLLLKIGGFFSFMTIFITICIICRSRVSACLAGILLLGASWLIYHGMSPHSWCGFLRPLMPVAFIDTESMLAQFRTVNCFGHPIIFEHISTGIAGSVIIIGLSASLFYFKREANTEAITFSAIPIPKLQSKHIHIHTCLLSHEAYKLIWTHRGIWILAAFCILQVTT